MKLTQLYTTALISNAMSGCLWWRRWWARYVLLTFCIVISALFNNCSYAHTLIRARASVFNVSL